MCLLKDLKKKKNWYVSSRANWYENWQRKTILEFVYFFFKLFDHLPWSMKLSIALK